MEDQQEMENSGGAALPAFLKADLTDWVTVEDGITHLQLQYPIKLTVKVNGQEQSGSSEINELRFRRPVAGDLEDVEQFSAKQSEMAAIRIVMAGMLQDQKDVTPQLLKKRLDAQDSLRMMKVFADFFPGLFQ